MYKIVANFSEKINRIKPMHCVNNGPMPAKKTQVRTNFTTYSEAGIPYARNHDASACPSYGGAHSVDVHAIFPNFDADENAPESYDFTLTDIYIKNTMAAGTKMFYRLGSKIEHEIKKYGTLVPKDFAKWARICEHIIRHCNEGWADGHHFGIEYWEIWNEPDLDADDAENKRNWSGTEAEFHDMYEIASKHLKKCFPKLKIGGPALACRFDWAERFLEDMQKRNVKMDFFSWHAYTIHPKYVMERIDTFRNLLDKCGYINTESILNEWNYVRGWGNEFTYSIKQIIGIKGAAYTAACMCSAQQHPLDMLMYYDARPCVFNGMFDFYTLEPLKGYYPFKMFNELYKLGNEARCKTEGEDIFAAAAFDKDNVAVMLSTFTENDEDTQEREIVLEFSSSAAKKFVLYLLDDENTMTEKVLETNKIILKPNSVALIKNIK